MSTELADQLRQGMERVPARVPADLVRTAYRRCRRRRIAVAAIVATGAAVAIGAVAAAAGLSGPAAPGARTTAYVVNRVTHALDTTSPDSIVFVRLTVTPPRADMPPTQVWAGSDGRWRVKTFTQAGHPVTDTETYDTPSAYLVFQVDYTKRTWWRWVGPGDFTPGQTPAHWSCNRGAPITYTTSARGMTDEIRTALSCGWLRAAGAGQVDGVSAVELTGTPGGVTATIWVSASTYLPVRITTTWPTYVLQEDTQWLPPTPANLAKLAPPIPAGFKHVPRPKGS
jgi:hypothetical protein